MPALRGWGAGPGAEEEAPVWLDPAQSACSPWWVWAPGQQSCPLRRWLCLQKPSGSGVGTEGRGPFHQALLTLLQGCHCLHLTHETWRLCSFSIHQPASSRPGFEPGLPDPKAQADNPLTRLTRCGVFLTVKKGVALSQVSTTELALTRQSFASTCPLLC